MNHNCIYMTNFDERHVPMPGPVADLRNWYCEQALAHKCAYLYFLDEDVTVPGHALRQLMYMMEHYPDAAVIGGVVPHKSDPQSPMVFRGNGNGPYWDWHVGEFFDASGIGMGCTLLRVDALKKIERPWFKTIDKMDAFLDGIPKAEVWTEDLYFCDKAIKAGWKVYADTSILCTHWDLATGRPYTLPPDCKPMRRLKITKGKKKIADLGSGESPYKPNADEEVITVDIRDEAKPDYRADLRRLPFANGEFDIVFSSHTLEHFSRADVPQVLDEWVRILKPEGELRLVLPNIAWAAEKILKNEIDNDTLNVVLGAQTFDGKKEDPFNFHKMLFTPETLTAMLKARGFKKIDIKLEGYNILARSWRVPPKNPVKISRPKGSRRRVEVRKTSSPNSPKLRASSRQQQAAPVRIARGRIETGARIHLAAGQDRPDARDSEAPASDRHPVRLSESAVDRQTLVAAKRVPRPTRHPVQPSGPSKYLLDQRKPKSDRQPQRTSEAVLGKTTENS